MVETELHDQINDLSKAVITLINLVKVNNKKLNTIIDENSKSDEILEMLIDNQEMILNTVQENNEILLEQSELDNQLENALISEGGSSILSGILGMAMKGDMTQDELHAYDEDDEDFEYVDDDEDNIDLQSAIESLEGYDQ